MSSIDNTEPRFTVLDRAIGILRVFRTGETTLSLGEIARRSGLPRSSAHRYLQSLVSQNFLSSDGNGDYRLGIALWEIGVRAVQSRLPLRDIEPYADDVASHCGETCHVGILDGPDVVYVVRAAGTAAVAVQTHAGQRVPAHATATGRTILSWLPAEVVHQHISDPLHRFNDDTPSTVDELIRGAGAIRQVGFVTNTGGWQKDMYGVAAPILGHDGSAVASIGVAGPAYRMSTERLNEFGEYIRDVAGTITERLGNR